MLEIFASLDAEPRCQLPASVSPVDLSLSGLGKVVLCADDEDDGFFRDSSKFVDPVANVFEALQIRDVIQDERDMRSCGGQSGTLAYKVNSLAG